MVKKSEASNEIVSVAPQSNIHWVSLASDCEVEEHANASKEFLHGIEGLNFWDCGAICRVLAVWG